MRRDNFTVSIQVPNADTDSPTIAIEHTGPVETLTQQLTGGDDQVYSAAEIDTAFRLQESLDEDDATGVFSLTHRVTGEFLLEVNADASAIIDLVNSARNADDDGRYTVRIVRTDGEPIEYELKSLLVYDSEGNLLRQRSLIPSGVEL
jgi:hypothetical protein